ncbi:SH2 domain-containing protein 3C-like isoform X2 [Melanotaenia boesemani]|uniref:SH2 domain-containing protein 3C-like isoform X2 n=1 Tax=Melanotaenia boesemani TaxID=1250792 RepID=UPI001C0499ED|nr:SH2 domain-containing protein 3C-like isoform X2 [Melanotaenia boesemani]
MNKKLSFKWFGSLTNLSSRRSSGKSKKKTAPEFHGSHCGAPAATVGDQSVDDMEPCLHSPNYARSSDMYTHVGTVPRTEKQKKSCKGKKNTEEEEKKEEGNKWKAGERVRDSPLLSALSSLSSTNMEQLQPVLACPLPATVTPSRASPLTPAPEACLKDLSDNPVTIRKAPEINPALETGRKPSNVENTSTTLMQDVYVPMDPISETSCSQTDVQTERQRGITCTQEISGSREEETAGRCPGVSQSGGEYVKFCKDTFWLELPSEKVRKQLEEELKLSSTDLKSHAWYHGCIPWEVSESLLVNHGDFLIRDSRSSQGDLVLTCRWEQKALHFLIRKAVLQPSETYTRVQYSLEDESFDSVPALVNFYVGSRASLTRSSGAQIHRPVNRMLPIRYLETTFCSTGSQEGDGRKEAVCPRSPSSLHHKGAEVTSEQLMAAGEAALAAHHHPQRCNLSVTPSATLSRSLETTRLQPSPSNPLSSQPRDLPRPCPQQNSISSDPDGSCYTELHPGPQSYVERLRVEEGLSGVNPLPVEDGNVYFSPLVETVSCFKPSRYQSPLMPKENKPLEVCILRRVKELLADVDPRTAAKHITKADCTVARILEVSPEVQRMMGVSSGMELLTLPHGQQLRLDLLERFQTMATMLAVDVLGCTGTNEERAALLHKIIQIAAELKSTMGNMFGFAAVMRALELPQISRLEQMWTTLRQRHTEGAILYEKTLRPFVKSLNDGRESCPLSSTTFPHVLPLLMLLEKSAAMSEGAELWDTAEVGVDVVMFHLGAARTIAQLGGIYRSNAESKLQGLDERAELRELFLTDFQMRLLWGSRGAEENQALRHSKFDQVLTALSNRLEPPSTPR